MGLTPIDHDRVRMTLRHCRGSLLDVGCGNNLLVRAFGGLGVDIHPYPEIDARCESAHLPFKDESFDSLALLACLNHMTRRCEMLRECYRVLRRDGRLLITMISPWVGVFSHKIRRKHDPDQLERGIGSEEDFGLSPAHLRSLLERSSFRVVTRKKFMWGLNSLYIAEKCGLGYRGSPISRRDLRHPPRE